MRGMALRRLRKDTYLESNWDKASSWEHAWWELCTRRWRTMRAQGVPIWRLQIHFSKQVNLLIQNPYKKWGITVSIKNLKWSQTLRDRRHKSRFDFTSTFGTGPISGEDHPSEPQSGGFTGENHYVFLAENSSKESLRPLPLGFGEREHHRARHRLGCPHRHKTLSSGRKVPPRTKPFSSVCWTQGSGNGQEIQVPSPTLTCLLPFPLSCFCAMIIWNSNLIGCSGFFLSQSGTTTHVTDKKTETCPKGTPVGGSELASPNAQQGANSHPLPKTLSFCAQTNACMAIWVHVLED